MPACFETEASSTSACLERVKRLENEGLIKRYVAENDLSKVCSGVTLMVEVVLENHREADFEGFLGCGNWLN